MLIFSIVIPVYNEQLNLDVLVEEIFLSLLDYDSKFELIFVNDLSTDDTLKVIKELKDKYPKIIKYISNKKNLGQSYSLTEGIKISKSNIIVTLDGDGQNNPKDIPKLLEKYLNNNNFSLISGIRFKRKKNYLKIISSKLANYVRKYILKDDCIDTGCSLKIFDKHIFLEFPFFDGIHRFLPALFKGYGKKTHFVNVDHRHRVFGASKYGTMGRLFRGIRDLIKVFKIIKKFKSNRD